jgi:hypothetical protein
VPAVNKLAHAVLETPVGRGKPRCSEVHMSIVPSLPSFSHSDAGDPIGVHLSRGGHPADELSIEALADASGEHLLGELPEDAADVLTDQTVSIADDITRNELAAAYARAKDLAGLARVKIGRHVTIDDYEGNAHTEAGWFAVIDHGSYGVGDSADAAVDAALANLDKTAGITPTASGGFFVKGKAVISAASHRTPAEALALARRVALNVAYLDTLVRFGVPGIVTADGPTTPATTAAATAA